MALTRCSIARLLQLGVPVSWQEAVAAVCAADAASDATGTPIALEHCYITVDGHVHLDPQRPGQPTETVSSLQLLQALLRGQARPDHLRVLAVAVDRRSPSEPRGDGRLRVDVRWCLEGDPRADVARLAARGIAAACADIEPAEEKADRPTLLSGWTGLAGSGKHARVDRRPVVTLRVQHVTPRVVLAIAAIVVGLIGAVGAVGALSGIRWSPATDATVEARTLPDHADTEAVAHATGTTRH